MKRIASLAAVRSSERKRFKRCVKAWYWEWRKGLVPRAAQFGALDLGTWMHTALANWYQKGTRRNGDLREHFSIAADRAIGQAQVAGAPDHQLEIADELAVLGEQMAAYYQTFYGLDRDVYVLVAEIPLEFTISDASGIIAVHKIKPDLVFLNRNRDLWLMEHKTAQSIRTEHLAIDDQARPYGAMSERALRQHPTLKVGDARFKGILYNFLRKAIPDPRPTNDAGKYLNQDGSISKRQPPPLLYRHPVILTNRAKAIALRRIQQETLDITLTTRLIREKKISPGNLPKTPHWSCPKHCQFWAMCKAEEEGADIRDMERSLYFRRDPYKYDDEFGTTDEPPTFEMG